MTTTSHAAVIAVPPTTWIYVAWWVGLLLLHVANTLYYLGFTAFYAELHRSNLAFQLKTYSIGIAPTEYNGIARTHAAIYLIHVVYILLMVGSSLAARRFVFYPSTSLSSIMTTLVSYCQRRVRIHNVSTPTDRKLSRLTSVPQFVIRSATRSMDLIFGREGLLGVDSVYFDDLLVVREVFETALQSYQAYRMTQLLPRLGLIRIYVVLLVANCWSVPIVHRVYQHQHHKRRIVSLLCDAVLDTISSMGITLVIFATYAPQYTDPRFGFPFTNWFNDEWFTAVLQEFQMMLVVSWGDMASRLVFALGLLQCMNAVKDMLEPGPGPGKSSVSHCPDTASAVIPSPPHAVRGPDSSLIIQSATKPRLSGLNRLQRVKNYVLHSAGPRCFVVWGVVILGVHAYSEFQASSWPCKLDLRPWLTSQPACSLVEIDCHSLGVSGSVASLEAAWTRFDPSLTAHLTIRHCRELEIPALIEEFNDLTSMKVYNSTIVSWPESAAITSTAHGTLRALYFVRTNFLNATLPPGLRTSQFPQSFRSFLAIATNLGSLPDDLDRVWPQRMSLALESSQFTAVPDVVMRLKPSLLSLSQSAITSVPASLFEIPTLANLLLCYTLVQELPRHVPNPSTKLYVVMLEGNPISTLWEWMDPIIARSFAYKKRYFNLHNTPFCAEQSEIEAGNRTSYSASSREEPSGLARVMDVSTAERLAYSKDAVACGVDMKSFFPLALEDAVSALTR